MNWTIEFLREQGIVVVTTSGIMRIEALREMSNAGLAAGKAFGFRKYLVDHRQTTPDLGTLDIHDLPDMYSAMGIGPDFRIATLLAENPAGHDAFEFFQLVIRNRGAHYFRQFTELDEAMRWLTGAD
jgi:hypothetical protein